MPRSGIPPPPQPPVCVDGSIVCVVVCVCVSACRMCQSLMKVVPLSQVPFGRGAGEEGGGERSSGVKDNRVRRAQRLHYCNTTPPSLFSLSLSPPFAFFLPSPFSQLPREDDVVEGAVLKSFVSSSAFRKVFQIVQQQQQRRQRGQEVEFGIVVTHYYVVLESCQ